jgi:glycosyltransferase involved in cell wall biosynthesis
VITGPGSVLSTNRETSPSRQPRVLILTEIISPYRIPVFNALAEHDGLDLHIIFLAETDEALRQWCVYKDEIHFSYQVLPSWRWRAGKKGALLNPGLGAALKRGNPQAIICGGYNYLASWQALWWARRRRVRFVLWSESNREDRRSGQAWIERMKQYFLRHCDAFVVPGKSAFAYLQHLGVGAPNIFTAPNAVDNAYFALAAENASAQQSWHRQRLGLPARFILYSGRLVPEKGVFDLLEAYAMLESGHREQVGLVFAGDGVSRGELVERAQQIRPGLVCFPGFAQREDLAVLYSLAEALILPTHSDTWGLVVNEAMVCGLPVVVTAVAGCVQDLVEDGWNGCVVPPRDPDRLTLAIRSLLEQPETRMQMSEHSRNRIQHYSPEACAQGLAQAALSSQVESS